MREQLNSFHFHTQTYARMPMMRPIHVAAFQTSSKTEATSITIWQPSRAEPTLNDINRNKQQCNRTTFEAEPKSKSKPTAKARAQEYHTFIYALSHIHYLCLRLRLLDFQRKSYIAKRTYIVRRTQRTTHNAQCIRANNFLMKSLTTKVKSWPKHTSSIPLWPILLATHNERVNWNHRRRCRRIHTKQRSSQIYAQKRKTNKQSLCAHSSIGLSLHISTISTYANKWHI